MINNILNIKGVEILKKENKKGILGGYGWSSDVYCLHICPGACDGLGNCFGPDFTSEWP